MSLFDPTLGALQRALDVRLLRHNLLAGNVANADTPGFVPRDLDFANAMRESAPAVEPGIPLPRASMTFASAGAGAGGAEPASGDLPLDAAAPALRPLPALTQAPGAGAGLDGNAVDVDRALTALAENAIQYGAAARAAQKKLAILRYAASDGAA